MMDFEAGFKECVKFLNEIEDNLYNEIIEDYNKVFVCYENNCKTLLDWVEIGGRNI
jgi:hypothetical protein